MKNNLLKIATLLLSLHVFAEKLTRCPNLEGDATFLIPSPVIQNQEFLMNKCFLDIDLDKNGNRIAKVYGYVEAGELGGVESRGKFSTAEID